MPGEGTQWWCLALDWAVSASAPRFDAAARSLRKVCQGNSVHNLDVVVGLNRARPGDVTSCIRRIREAALAPSTEIYIDVEDPDGDWATAPDYDGCVRFVRGSSGRDTAESDERQRMPRWRHVSHDTWSRAMLASSKAAGIAGIVVDLPAAAEGDRVTARILADWLDHDDPTFPVEPVTSLVGGLLTGDASREWVHWSLLQARYRRPSPGSVGLDPIPSAALLRLDRLRPIWRRLDPSIQRVVSDRFPPRPA